VSKVRWFSARRGRRGLTEPLDPHVVERELIAAVAQRSLAVTTRVISAVDAAERDDPDPAVLDLLYGVDHGLARLRRWSENLLTLSGFSAPASGTRAMSLLSLARAAVAECADYTAITLTAMPTAFIRPGTADEIAHILAELLDNGLSASGGRPVRLTATRPVADGPVFYEVADDGPVPPQALLDTLNARVTEEPRLTAATPRHMGLFVVAKLSQRLGVRVLMTAHPAGGIAAQVQVPADLVIDAAPPAPAVLRGPRPGSAQADRWGAGPRPEAPEQRTPGGLAMRTRVTAPWRPEGARPQLRRPSPDSVNDAAALDGARRSPAAPQATETNAEEGTRT
jgi:hypothetical protein